MNSHRALKIFSLPCLALFLLAGCAPSPDAIATSAVTVALPTLVPTILEPTVIPPSPTAQPTLTHAEQVASQLTSLPGYKWTVNKSDAGDLVSLTDAQNNPFAFFDEKVGGIRWDIKTFGQLNGFLTVPEGQKNLSQFLTSNEKNNIHFITYPAAPDNGKMSQPTVVVLAPDGNQIRVVQGMNGTKDFSYNIQNKRIDGISSYYSGLYQHDGTSSYYSPQLNKFVYDQTLLQELIDNGSIDFKEPERVQTVKEALKLFQTYDPTVITAEDIINATTMGNTNFKIYYDSKFGQGSFDEAMEKFKDVDSNLANFYRHMGRITYYKNAPLTGLCPQTCWRAYKSDALMFIGLDDEDFMGDRLYLNLYLRYCIHC